MADKYGTHTYAIPGEVAKAALEIAEKCLGTKTANDDAEERATKIGLLSNVILTRMYLGEAK